jgi:ZIP family zinc transporter
VATKPLLTIVDFEKAVNTNNRNNIIKKVASPAGIGGIATALLAVLSVVVAWSPRSEMLAAGAAVWKVVAISWVAFAAMALGAWVGGRADETEPFGLVWGYGLASGAMIMSATMFLVPQAIGLGTGVGNPRAGGIGLALGVVVGYSAHTVGHRLTHVEFPIDITAAQITVHALAAGAIIGLVYNSMPSLGLLLGLAIVSHKAPAGYAAARRLRRQQYDTSILLLPAAGVGLTAVPTALVPIPSQPVVNAVVFGFAAGIFLHVAMDFLPKCETGSEIDQVVSVETTSHALLDRLRTHAVGSTLLGSVAVVVAWIVVS